MTPGSLPRVVPEAGPSALRPLGGVSPQRCRRESGRLPEPCYPVRLRRFPSGNVSQWFSRPALFLLVDLHLPFPAPSTPALRTWDITGPRWPEGRCPCRACLPRCPVIPLVSPACISSWGSSSRAHCPGCRLAEVLAYLCVCQALGNFLLPKASCCELVNLAVSASARKTWPSCHTSSRLLALGSRAPGTDPRPPPLQPH